MPTAYRLYGAPGWGSAIVEAALALANAPFDFIDVDGFDEPGPARDRLAKVNPLLQVPAFVLPDGEVMTESAAIVLHLAETFPGAGLAPQPGAPDRPRFLRRLVWFTASVYATFPFTDYPERFAPLEPKTLEERALARRCDLWRQYEVEFGDGPFALGEAPCALDLYIAVMTRWRPRRDWFAANCPKLHAVALATEALPALAPVFARNFPD